MIGDMPKLAVFRRFGKRLTVKGESALLGAEMVVKAILMELWIFKGMLYF